MSDVGFDGVDFGAIAEANTAPAETPDMPVGDVNWEERYKAEVQDRIKERERYKPIKQVFDRMHPDDAQAVQQFANAWASGDQESAIRWMIDNAKTLAGDNFNQYITPAQTQQVINNATAQGNAAGLTPDAVQQLVAQQLEEFQTQQAISYYEVQIDQTLRELGLDPASPLGHAAIIAATNREDLDLKAAVSEMENQILQQAQGIVQRRQAGNAQMPSSAPQGVPGVISPSATPRERAMARLNQEGI